ncbi:MAG: transketolase family protein [Acidobacteriota bacterium]
MSKKSLRGEYGKTLLKLGKNNKNIVVMDADLAKSTKTNSFGDEFPSRFIDMGLSEQDMISTAAGISLTGKTVFASSFCVFLVGRVYDQIRQSVCYNNSNVKLVATHSGLGVGEDGATHQALEDIALLRPLPNIRIIVPADSIETSQVIEYVSSESGPFYIRLTRNDLIDVHDENYKFIPGKASVLKDGEDITIFAIGAMVEKAMVASKLLENISVNAAVVNLSSIKPLDNETVLHYAKKTKNIITIEDHSVFGGLGGVVSEFLSQNFPVKMKIMGVNNSFGRSGTADALYKYFKLDPENIVVEAKKLLEI